MNLVLVHEAMLYCSKRESTVSRLLCDDMDVVYECYINVLLLF